uniref:hypothetical protein n=1 Tax=Flavobacterium sp. TaxID=239 RepID=UPI00404B786D
MNSKNDKFFKGDFVTSYLGMNKRINHSKYKLFSQSIELLQSFEINGQETVAICFEINFLKRKFLIVLDRERVYEVLEEKGQKVYMLLTESWMYVINHFEDKEHYITQGTFNLHYLYNEEAEFVESFNYELILPNDNETKMLFNSLRLSHEEELITAE